MDDLIKTKVPGFLKNTKTGVIVNTDTAKFDQVKMSRTAYKQQRALELKVKELEERVNKLESILTSTRVTGIND